ncbi:hypothetical protein A2U01_0042421, partial [Trifolium medium]|nr:hypothetical protein [Trifolium medium]
MADPNLEGLSLHEEGEEGFSFEFEEEGEEQVDLQWCLVGRFLCERPIHFNSMKVRMVDLWQPVKGVIIKEAKPGIFLFSHPLDMEGVHNLPLGLMKEKVGITLANYIGTFVEYDKNNNSSFWRQYMRIRVKIDVRQPLKKDTRVKNNEGEWCTVNFKYERLGV